MSGFAGVNRYTLDMTLSEQDILRTLMKSRDRIAAAAWVVVRDAHAAEDIFQNVALKALTKEVSFEAELTGLDSEVLELLEQGWLSESADRGGARMEALRMCLQSLPAKSSRLLRLRYFEGKSCGEVAKNFGTELNVVYKRLSRLHRGLKECIEIRLNKSEARES
jgi:DNA-directed RNA polymerase specialized sigma24 family protein